MSAGTLAARDVWFLVEKAREAGATRIEATNGDLHVVVSFGDLEVADVVPLTGVERAPGAPYTYPEVGA